MAAATGPGTYYWVNTGNTEEQGYTGPEPTVMGYNPPPVTPGGTPVVAPQSLAGSRVDPGYRTADRCRTAGCVNRSLERDPRSPGRCRSCRDRGYRRRGPAGPALVDPTAEPGTVPEIRLIRYPERPGNDLIVFFRLHFISG